MCGGHQQNKFNENYQDIEEANKRVSFVEFYTIIIASAISWTSMRMSADWKPALFLKIHMQKRKEQSAGPQKSTQKESANSAGTEGGCNNLKHRTYGLVTNTKPKTNHY